MAYIKLLIAVIIFVFTVTKIETKNCSKDRGSKVLSKNNGTYPEEYFEEISVVLKQKAGFEENATLSGYHLPHNYVPSITETERDYVNVLSSQYLSRQPPFDLSHIPGVSKVCKLHSQHFIASLKSFDLWAMKMHDATAKLSSGLLNGNVNQYGDFDECLSVEADNLNFKGKYCLAYFQPKIPQKSLQFINYLRRLAQSHDAFKSTFDDPGHRVPRFSSINFALCVPSSCSTQDVELGVKHYTNEIFNRTGIEFDMKVDDEMCQTKEETRWESFDDGTKITIYICGLLTLILISSTFYDYFTEDDSKNDWINSFSLIKNTKSLFSVEDVQGDIKTAHAIRLFNAIMLLVSHKCMALFFNPYTNRTDMTESLGKPYSVLARAASLYTDPFLMMSGMLTAYSLFGKLQKTGRFNIAKEFIGRYIRIMPSLAFLIAICTFILPLMGSGPQWNLVVSHHSDICKQYWWRNLLFIHNWFGFSQMCLTHTHHIGIDTELFLTAPFLILIIWKWPKFGLRLIISLATLSTVARYYVTYNHNLNNYVFFGTSIKQLFETADRMYIMPQHRFTVYSMGLLLGYALRITKNHVIKLSSKQLKFGWYFSVGCLLAAFFGPAPMGDIDYVYNPTHAAYYAAIAPIAWCIFFAWIILLSQLGYSNKFIEILEWRVFKVCTRFSYSLYLTQFPIFFFNVGRLRSPLYFRILSTIVNLNEYVIIVVVSILLTLFIEMPCSNLKTLILDRKSKSVKLFSKDRKGIKNE